MLLQLRDCTINVAAKSIPLRYLKCLQLELKFTSDCFLGWFNKKYKSTNLELSNEVKKQHETENLIKCKKGKCCIFTFLLETHSEGTDKMSSFFYI